MAARSRGFTLVELLVVLALLGLFAATLAVACAGLNRQARYESTRSLVNALDAGCEAYRVKLGRYPGSPSASADTTVLHPALCRPLTVVEGYTGASGPLKTLPPFVELPSWRVESAPQIRDDWGWPVRYSLPGADHSPNGTDNSRRFDIDASSAEAGSLGNWNAHR
jgi:general secretion pathway protein G